MLKGMKIDDTPEGTLQNAVALGSHAKTIECISTGVNIYIKNAEGDGLLHIACYNGHIDIVAELVNAGLDINGRGHLENTPLHVAVSRNHQELIEWLVGKFILGVDDSSPLSD